MRQINIIAHRGESFDAPENTISAFNLAWNRGCTGVEMDIHLTSDGKVVVIHDHDTFRVCGEKHIVAESTYNQLASLNIKLPGKSIEKIPLLSDVLANVPDGRKLFIEIKTGAEILLPLKEVVDKSGLDAEQIILISFSHEVLVMAENLFPGVKRLFLDVAKDCGADTAERLISICRQNRFDGADLHFVKPAVSDFINNFHNENLLVYTWTVDEPEIAECQIIAGVDGITSNRAAWLRDNFRLKE